MIRLQHISKTFPSKGQTVQALRDVSLDIPDGEIFGVIGFSGAGKSTLLRMVNALETPDTGSVEIDGQELGTLGHKALRDVRKGIGMVFQQFNLLESQTVAKNIAIPLILSHKVSKEEIEQRVETLLDFVELADKKDAYPWQLSGGQKQRVGIARALATNPRILLCDEATSALDPETTGSILELLARVNREMNITILFVTHQVQVIKELCRKVAVMEQGQIVETGSAVDIFSHPQREVTRRFVQAVIPDAIPKSLYTMLQQEQRPFRLLRLRFLGENAKENILFRINTELHVESSVLFASVNEIQKQIVSVFIVQFIGSVEQLEEVAKLLESRGVAYEEVESYESRSA